MREQLERTAETQGRDAEALGALLAGADTWTVG